MLDRVPLETGGVGKESLDMARGRCHFPSTIKHFYCFMFWAISNNQTCTEIAGEPDNVLIVPSRNVLLTGSTWRGGFRNISHDATRPRPAGRIEKGKEGTDHPAASRGGDRPDRAACSSAAEADERQRRQGHR